MTKHLYIHIPFCKSICTYCDFVRIVNNNDDYQKKYIDQILNILKKEAVFSQFQTIYIGGGTPNHLSDANLDYLLSNLLLYLDTSKPYEFCLELNPELVSASQVLVLQKNQINRVSLGVQTTNNLINKLLHRHHTLVDVIHSIELLRKVNINNISCDFIYNLPLLTKKNLDDALAFLKQYEINHVSFYALEMKENSILNKQHYQLNTEQEQEQYAYLNQQLPLLGYERYEIASYTKNQQYSLHNLGYWLNHDWKAIGSSAYGFENNHYYKYKNDINELIKVDENYSEIDLYQHLLIMGLRTIFGLDLNIQRNLNAYLYYEALIKDDVYIDEKNHLHIKDMNFLDDCLLKII